MLVFLILGREPLISVLKYFDETRNGLILSKRLAKVLLAVTNQWCYL